VLGSGEAGPHRIVLLPAAVLRLYRNGETRSFRALRQSYGLSEKPYLVSWPDWFRRSTISRNHGYADRVRASRITVHGRVPQVEVIRYDHDKTGTKRCIH
jgi:hypothetical protein